MKHLRDEIAFKQIAVVGSGVDHWLYGLSKDGDVYHYNHRAAVWEPLTMAVNGALQAEDVVPSVEADSNTSIAQPCGSRWQWK